MNQDAVVNHGTAYGRGTHAIVIGGSMAGLLCARVLSGFFDRVTLFERDHFPEGPTFRTGVPQSRHLHVLLARGLRVLEQFFPGLETELLAAGAETIGWHTDMLRLTPVGWAGRFPNPLTLVSASRELFEWSVRRRVAALPNVRLADAYDTTGLLADIGKTAVTGVVVRRRAPASGTVTPSNVNAPEREPHEADLIIDASGRDSHAPEWLTELGYAPPPVTRVDARLGYASRYYVRPAPATPTFPPATPRERAWNGILVTARPDNPRGGGLLPIEGGRWLVTLAGYGGTHPPTDDAGFLDFARAMRSPVLYDAIAAAEPLSPVRGYQRTENRWRHFDRLDRWPERFLVAGDAECAFNPVYGQGMTAAALAATALEGCLREQRRRTATVELTDFAGVGRRFQHALAKSSAAIWLLSTGEDLRFRTTVGASPTVGTRIMHRYLDRVIAVSTENEHVDVALARVLHLLRPPETLFAPHVLIPALAGRRLAGLRTVRRRSLM
jgi:2-polyprenyl-6-methoxyphenol hydroxylase-like FAD-dependent oxidoreductase